MLYFKLATDESKRLLLEVVTHSASLVWKHLVLGILVHKSNNVVLLTGKSLLHKWYNTWCVYNSVTKGFFFFFKTIYFYHTKQITQCFLCWNRCTQFKFLAKKIIYCLWFLITIFIANVKTWSFSQCTNIQGISAYVKSPTTNSCKM